jgi:hypothetical protein
MKSFKSWNSNLHYSIKSTQHRKYRVQLITNKVILNIRKHMKVQNLLIALTTSILAVSSNPSWSVAARSTQLNQNTDRQIPSSLIADMTYGTTRTNRTCASQVNPKKGAISLEQAKTYFICRYETFTGPLGRAGSFYTFVDDLNMQMAAARPANGADLGLGYKEDIDSKQPVHPIKVSYVRTFCGARNIGGLSESRQGKCLVNEVKGIGICFRNTFSEWHCKIRGQSTSAVWAKPRN